MKHQAKRLYNDIYADKTITLAQEAAIKEVITLFPNDVHAVNYVMEEHGHFEDQKLYPLNHMMKGHIIYILMTGKYNVINSFEEYLKSELELTDEGTYAWHAIKRIRTEYFKRKDKGEF